MTEITRTVAATELSDLLSSARVAIVAWSRDGDVEARPASFRFESESYLIGLPARILADGTEVAVLVDDGPLYFDLRGVRVRGPATAVDRVGDDALDWFRVEPEREVAWHYGALRPR